MGTTDKDKSREQLISELSHLRGRLAQMETLEAAHELPSEALTQSEEKFSKAFQLTPDSMLITRLADERILDVSDCFLRTTGYDRQELQGKTATDLAWWCNHADKERYALNLERCGECHDLCTTFRAKDGRTIPVRISGRVIEMDGQPCVISVIRDVSDRIRTENALRESRRMLQLVMDNIPQAIFWKDRNLVYLGCNRNFARDAGLDNPEDIIGKTDYELAWKEEEADFYRECDRRVMTNDVPEYHIIEPQLQADGKQAWLDTNKVPLHDAEDNVVGILGTYEDITERKMMEAALQNSAEQIKFFAYSISHDLKSPAVGIYGLAKRLYGEHRGTLDEKGKLYCDQILKASEQIASLVEKINLYISAREAPFNVELVSLRDILQSIREEFAAQFTVRQVEWVEPETIQSFRADRIGIIRILRNLVDNALKYGGDTLTKIEIAWAEIDSFYRLSVTDDGVGIDMENSDRIFGLFQRHETAKGVEGSGLGLAIVKTVAEQHGGRVWVESAPTRGTTFHVTFSRYL